MGRTSPLQLLDCSRSSPLSPKRNLSGPGLLTQKHIHTRVYVTLSLSHKNTWKQNPKTPLGAMTSFPSKPSPLRNVIPCILTFDIAQIYPVYRLISFGTCCLGGWSGHGSRYMESQHKLNGLCTHGLRNT
ncbi:hypothetical protein HanXRQr2_Chr16g0765801 [Helianthus annuus]|uniref:Uncharacterized protein n=1 Tax=Helianthus annuus TaxID=4232 RepID=A0A9K3GZG6_HELAN|nr:hypothetical protein HanXRQr2_Chr16g0765801 [Helianthus annuus]